MKNTLVLAGLVAVMAISLFGSSTPSVGAQVQTNDTTQIRDS